MSRGLSAWTLPALLAAVLWSGPAGAVDPHALYEDRCAGCHAEHSLELARSSVDLEDGVLVGRQSRRPLAAFLQRHGGGGTPEEIAALLEMLGQQLQDGGLFQERCGICHESGREVAHTWLVLRDGRLVGRYSGRDIADFLRGHGTRTEDEAARLTDMLVWQRQVVERP